MRLRIQNFKSYVDTGFLDLKPLTLIFGKNSAGKSAVVQALNALSGSSFANEKRIRENYASGDSTLELSFYGDTWDLGDFERTVHNRDETNLIKFELEFNLLEQEKKRQSEKTSQKPETALQQFTADNHIADIKTSIGLGFETPGTLNFLSIITNSEIPFSSITGGKSEQSLVRGIRLGMLIDVIFDSLRNDERVQAETFRLLARLWRKARGNLREPLRQKAQIERSRAKVDELRAKLDSLRQFRNVEAENFEKNQIALAKETDDLKKVALDELTLAKSARAVSHSKELERVVSQLRAEVERLEKLQTLRSEERVNFGLRAEELQWIKKYESPEIFMMNCSAIEFEEAFRTLADIFPPTVRHMQLMVSHILAQGWRLPPIELTINKCPEKFAQSIRKQLKKKNPELSFIDGNNLFFIEHDFIIQCLNNLPIPQIAEYWTEKVRNIRFVTSLVPITQIFPISVSEDGPTLINAESIYDSALGVSDSPFGSISFIGSVISHALRRFREELEGFTHIPAFRGSPKRTWDRDSRDEIAKSLNRLSKKELRKLNSALSLIGWKQSFDVSIDSGTSENRKIPKLRALGSTKRNKEFETLLDVGFGFSQILPILENAIRQLPKNFLIEEPEVHLHPSLQGDLIELIARNSAACTNNPMERVPVDSPVGNDHKWFIETHSEYMLRRIQKLVAKGVLDNKKVSIYYCDIDDEGERVIWPIKLGQKGQMLDPWPNDFIETELETELDLLNTHTEQE